MRRSRYGALLLPLVVLWGALLSSGSVAARPAVPEPDVLDADDPMVSDDLGVGGLDVTAAGPSDEDMVLAAQKLRTTVQEAPSIIYVVTRKQIQERGYRTINEVLRTVPGFEGDRWEGNGWQQESFAKGLPRTVLILYNGVNIVEPLRNFVSLDRKIPLEMVERIEITSGPGGVLWGANALLGVVNIVTRRPDDTGVIAVVGAGDGPGERLAAKTSLGVSHRFNEDVGVFAYLDFFTSNGPELTVDAQKVIGSLPEPAADTPTLYLPKPLTMSSGQRSWWLNFSGRLELGKVFIDWMLPFEQDYRPIATGGAVLTEDYLGAGGKGTPSASQDSVRLFQLTYADRFGDGNHVGLKARGYFVQWNINDKPFGVYPASPLIMASQGHTKDLRLALTADFVARPGAAIDVDWQVNDTLVLLAGVEGFVDINRRVLQTSWKTDTLAQCPDGFAYDAHDPYLKCSIDDLLVDDVTRVIGGGFMQADWRVHPRVVLTGGLRLQLSSQFDPALLWSGGVVWKVGGATHLKLFGSSGLRPPGVVSTNVRDTSAGISFKANPDLRAETSTSFEFEANTMLLQDEGVIRDLYLRGNTALTLMKNVIGRPGGRFENSEAQRIVSAEGLARLRFQGGHEVWSNYTFTKVFDDSAVGGELRNFSAHIFNLGGRLSFLDDHIELDGILTVKGEMTDPNRPPYVDPSRPDYSVSCANIPPSHPLASTCVFPTLSDGVWVMPGTRVDERIKPVALLNLGVRFKNLWRDLTASLFFYNILNHSYYEADFFNDARVLSRPQPKPGFSFFGQLSIGL